MLNRDLIAATLAPWEFDAAELAAFAESLTRLPQQAIRLRSGVEPQQLPWETTSVAWHPQGRFAPGDSRPGASLEFACGEFYIQDASSLLAVALLDPQPGETICDLCAAPGGKATSILDALEDDGWLLANEAVQSRLGMLAFNLARHGSSRFVLSSLDPGELAQRLAGRFDAVLVDVPCSGQSLISRGKQTSSAFHDATIEHCAARQVRILDAAEQLVHPGGRMVYSTCTFAYSENEGQVESFLHRHADWHVEESPVSLAGLESDLRSGPGLRLWPHRHGCAGAFASLLRRGPEAMATSASGTAHREGRLHRGALPHEFRDWGTLRSGYVCRNREQIFVWPDGVPEDLIAASLAGPEVSFCKGSTWFPSYGLAMRRDEHWSPVGAIDLNDSDARKYLRGEVLAGDRRGWLLATWRGRPLGWVKGDGRQWKNHLPKAGRLT